MSKQNKARLILDLITFIALLVASAPHFTGEAIHEWLALALSGAVITHLLLNWNWIIEISSRLFKKSANKTWFNYFLNWALFAAGIMIVLSGLMISKTVVPFFGISLPQNMSWKELHELSTNIIMILMGLHVAVHWNWIVNMFKNIFITKPVSHGTLNLAVQRKESSS